MLISHNGKKPEIHPSTYIAPTATICGDVEIGSNCRIMHGASIVAEGGQINIGDYCIVLENAVIRSTFKFSTSIDDHCLIGPNSHLAGCKIHQEVFIATGASVFHGAILETKSEVRINGVVHIRTRLKENQVVPIGWIAVGNPAELFSPDRHEEIWKIQEPLNFPLTVYGYDRPECTMRKITQRLAENLGSHMDDTIITDN